MRRLELEGQQFNSWTVLEYAGNRGWICRCLCGSIRNVTTQNLRNGTSSQCWDCGHKLPDGECAFNDIYGRYRASAKKRNLEFDLDKLLFHLLITLPCNYCGQDANSIWPNDKRNDMNGNFIYSGLDRVDSSIGYISTNIVPCCKTCNYMKQSLSESEFLSHIHRVARFRETHGG